jgi:hypothetical protein
MKKEDLLQIVNAAKGIFKAILDSDPRLKALKGHLVLSSPHGQCELTGDPFKILKEFPAMVSGSQSKTKATELLETIKRLEEESKNQNKGDVDAAVQTKIADTLRLLNVHLQEIEFEGDTFVEMRFDKPQLDLIFEMKSNPLVSQAHTPQTQASVRVVLGTLTELAHSTEHLETRTSEYKQP